MSAQAGCIDNAFGPWAGPECRGGFDFTLLFEETVLSIPVSSLFILIAPLRIWRLVQGNIVLQRPNSALLKGKAFVSIAIICFNLTLLALWATAGSVTFERTQASIATAVLTFIASLLLPIVSFLEHSRSVRPSFVLETYLFLAVLLGLARTRTLWLMGGSRTIPAVNTCAIALQAVLAILEATEKRSVLQAEYTDLPPEATSGSYNHSVFFWLNRLFFTGYKRILTLEDVYVLDPELDSEALQSKLQAAWDRVPDKSKPGSLMAAWLSTRSMQLLAPVFPKLCQLAFIYTQPFLVTQAIALAYSPNETEFNNLGYGLIGAYALVYFGIAIANGQYQWRMSRLAVAMRGAVVPCVLRKTLLVDSGQANQSAVITLINTDVDTIHEGVLQIHETWGCMVEIAVAGFLLWRQLGAVVGVPLGFVGLVIIGTVVLAVPVGKAQASWIQASETRVSATSRLLGTVKSFRFSGLNQIAFDAIESLRSYELRTSKKFRLLFGAAMILSMTVPTLSPVISFSAFAGIAAGSGDTVTISRAFTSLSLFALLTRPVTNLLVALPTIAGAVASFERIQAYMNEPERRDGRTSSTSRMSVSDGGTDRSESKVLAPQDEKDVEREKPASSPVRHLENHILVNGKFTWPDGIAPVIDIDGFTAAESCITLILGPVGCGKTTFLKALLGELSGFEGTIQLNQKNLAFCAQSPWIPSGSIKQAIVGRSKVDEGYYDRIVNACALQQDIQTLPGGDEAQVGNKGSSLSGGQKQRVALARAMYSARSVVVLDDVFSGLDAETAEAVMVNLLGPSGLLRSARRTVIMTSSRARHLEHADQVVMMNAEGRIIDRGSPAEIGPRWPEFVYSEPVSDTEPEGGFKLQSKHAEAMATPAEQFQHENAKGFLEADAEADLSRQTGDSSVYKYYAAAAGLTLCLTFVAAMAIHGFCESFPQLWLKWWSEANAREPNQDLGRWLGVYAALSAASIIAATAGAWQIFIAAITKTGRYFHSMLIETVSNAPLALFTVTDHGVTLNRFSQDLYLVDMELPAAAIGVATSVAVAVAQCVMMGVSSRYVAVTFPFILMIFYLIQKFYLRTSRQMRFLDIELKAPLYSQTMEIVSGLISVRAFGWETQILERSYSLLNDSQRPSYCLECLQRWLTLSVDLVVAFLAIILIVITTTLRQDIGPGFMGIALTNIVAFSTTLQALLISWVALEIAIGAVARIKNFVAAVPPETPKDDKTFSLELENWPSAGAIELKQMSAKYPNTGRVLHNVTLSIRPGEKIGVCGRSGSGKSSLALSLFRMIDLDGGSISVDGVDLASVPHKNLRTSITGSPQDACLLEGSVKFNVDPHGQATDGQIMDVLERLELWPSLESRQGLDTVADEAVLSQGQLQLVAFARAMLRKCKVLVLDEASSSLDSHSQAIMDREIRSWFGGCTVIAIAHRIESIRDFDRVLVLDAGKVVEYDEPEVLLARDSMFKQLSQRSD